MYNRNNNYSSTGDGMYSYTYQTSPILYNEKKHKKNPSVKVTAIMLIGSVVLSSLLGFGGGLLAGRIDDFSQTTVQSGVPITSVSVSEYRKNAGLTAEVAAAAMESVVEIRTESVTLGNRIMGQYISEGAGSGVVFSADGYIVTNNHVIDGANKIAVTMRDGTEYDAALIGNDAKTDLAVLKIDGKELKPVIFGDSEALVVGEQVVAIGNPLGQLGGTVTTGIISSLDREIDIEGEKMTLLQTDASVNPGNSGGGLFDSSGSLIGIVNAKSSGSGIEGLGFAIPINSARPIIEQLIENGYVSGRVDIGMSFMDVSERAAFIYGMNSPGAYVAEVERGSAAEKIGIRAGDRIVSINGDKVSDTEQLMNLLEKYSVGDSVKIQVERGGKRAEASLVLEEEVNKSGKLF